MKELISDLVAANRVLARYGIVDGYGHVSARDPNNANQYLIAWGRAPELVEDGDIVTLDLDSQPVAPESRPLYSERFIHGELYRARPDVQSIVHHHAPSIIPFGVTGVPLRPLYHMSAFVGEGVPVYEIRDASVEPTDMLVRNPALARALAACVGSTAAALMRGHGAVVVGVSLAQAIGRCMYLELNARLQLDALRLGGDIRYLDADEVRLATRNLGHYERSWELWKKEGRSAP